MLFARPEASASSENVTGRVASTTWRTKSPARSMAWDPDGLFIALVCTGSIVQYGVLQCDSRHRAPGPPISSEVGWRCSSTRWPATNCSLPTPIEVLDRGWRRIVSEIGVQFVKPEATELFAKAGQKVDGQTVWLDPDFVMEQVAKAPGEFDVQARNPANNVHVGGDSMIFSGVYGPPFVRAGTYVATPRSRTSASSHARAELPRVGLGRRGDLRAQRCAARLAAPRHDLCSADADRQVLHGKRRLGRKRARHDQDDRDALRQSRSPSRRRRRRSRSSTATRRFAGTTGCSTRSSSTTSPISRSC